MKKALFALFLLAAGMPASAQDGKGQVVLTPMAGVNVSWMAPNLPSDESSAKVGLVAGVEAEYMVSEKLGVSLGALYSQLGRNKEDGWHKSLTEEIDYLNVPLMVNYHVWKGLTLKAGIQPGLRLSSKWDGEEYIYRVDRPEIQEGVLYESTDISEYLQDDAIYGYKGKDFNDNTNGVVIGIPVGVAYEYKGFVLDARFILALNDTYKDISSEYVQEGKNFWRGYRLNEKSKNRNFQITLGYRFRL